MKSHTDLHNPAETTARSIEDSLDSHDNLLFLSAGGSSLSVLEHLGGDAIRRSNVTVGVLDERFTTDGRYNNFHQLLETQFGQQLTSHSSTQRIDTTVSSPDTLETVTERLRHGITDWKGEHPDGHVIALVGIGKDGHIAGMIPTPDPAVFKQRFCGDDYVVGYQDNAIDNEFSKRITVTMRFFTEWLDHAFVYAAGKQKCPVLTQLLRNSSPVVKFPANVLHDVSATLFTDCRLNSD